MINLIVILKFQFKANFKIVIFLYSTSLTDSIMTWGIFCITLENTQTVARPKWNFKVHYFD